MFFTKLLSGFAVKCHPSKGKLTKSFVAMQFIDYKQKSSTPKTSTIIGSNNSLIIDKNLHLRLCNSYSQSQTSPKEQSDGDIKDATSRPLVVLFSWLMAREKNLEKYRSLYFQRGFDVLTVKTGPFEMLFPQLGSQKVAENLFVFLKKKVSNYPNILVHGFSVGAYQFGEMLIKLQEGLSRPEVDGTCEIVRNSIKGMIFDSAVDVEGAAYGISRSFVGENKFADILEIMINGHMKLFYNYATKHYEASSSAYKNPPFNCPALLLLSREDRLGNPHGNEVVADSWRKRGIDVHWKCWENSKHCQHLHRYPEEYVGELEKFLKLINLGQQSRIAAA